MFRALILRFALPLVALVAVVSWLAAPYVDRVLTEWFRRDVELRAHLVMASIEDTLVEYGVRANDPRLARFLERVTADERLVAVLVCRPDGRTVYRPPTTPEQLGCGLATLPEGERTRTLSLPGGTLHVAQFDTAGTTPLRVLIVHDLSFVERRSGVARNYLIVFAAASALVLILLVVGSTWLLLRSWISGLVRDIRVRRFDGAPGTRRMNTPVLLQVREALRAMEEAHRQEIEYRENWTPQALQHVVAGPLDNPQIIVVSNREPYIHDRRDDGSVQVRVPASGMVTALEPVMQACSGTWVAHGSGNADREAVDRHDRVRVPPDRDSYTLRRVWLDADEEEGYYYGFSNEGLWPLCHIAFVRPAFRASDWQRYRAVNARFAEAVEQEAQRDDPIVLIQDYHFSLLPERVRERLPDATIALFWHIPWPNVETFGVCPWKRELLTGLLGADILGFHTRYHCQNFLETVDRFVECQIDHEHMTVTVRGHVCHIAAYPISIAWPHPLAAGAPPIDVCRVRVRERHRIRGDVRVIAGVERWDFTKGIVERLLALELALTRDPTLVGKVTLVQVAAPTRSKLAIYQAIQEESRRVTDRVNERFGTADWRPVVLVGEHQEPPEVFEILRAADVCIVNSLHDGMNLVAKEFVAARDDDDGVLILSSTAGASRELHEALAINPFDIEQTAETLQRALAMPREERRQRMQLMRRTVRDNNVYRWAGRILIDAARIRQHRQLAVGEAD